MYTPITMQTMMTTPVACQSWGLRRPLHLAQLGDALSHELPDAGAGSALAALTLGRSLLRASCGDALATRRAARLRRRPRAFAGPLVLAIPVGHSG